MRAHHRKYQIYVVNSKSMHYVIYNLAENGEQKIISNLFSAGPEIVVSEATSSQTSVESKVLQGTGRLLFLLHINDLP